MPPLLAVERALGHAQFADLAAGQLKLGASLARASACAATTVSMVDPPCIRRNIDLMLFE